MGVLVVGAVVFGAILVVGVRSLGRAVGEGRRNGVQTVQPPTPDDHWHVAYGVNVCGQWLAPFTDRGPDRYGIHTQGDGIIHVQPLTAEVSGPNATFGVFSDQVGMVLGDDAVRLPDGSSRANGTDCDGSPASWRLVDWDVDHPATAPVVRYSGLAAAPFGGDRHAMTLAFLPDGADVPKPTTIPMLDQLTDATTTTTTTRPPRTTPTTRRGGPPTTTTTAPPTTPTTGPR